LDPARIIFGDEKLLKGQEIFNRLVRRDPMTGQKPAINPDPDFRNTHSITGFCSIAGDRKPLLYRIHEGNNNAEEFACDVESALLCGYLRPGDFLVLDNAAYHMGKENDVLEDWLWEDHGVMLIFLPPRSPEWNPIELVWAILVRRLRTTDLVSVRETYGNNASANVAADILDDISLDEVKKCYRHCYQFIANLLNKN
jgi:transposase